MPGALMARTFSAGGGPPDVTRRGARRRALRDQPEDARLVADVSPCPLNGAIRRLERVGGLRERVEDVVGEGPHAHVIVQLTLATLIGREQVRELLHHFVTMVND